MSRPVLSSVFATAPDPKSRFKAIGKAVFYLVIAFVAALLVSAALKAATGKTLQALLNAGPVEALIAHAGLLFALVIVPTAVSLRLWKDPVSVAGWSATGSFRLASLGLAFGAGMMALIVGILWVSGAWSASVVASSLASGIGMALVSALLWLTQAAHEEGLHRGYAFVQLSRALSFWPAAAILSLWFVWGHVGQAGATPVSLAVAGLFALVFAYSFWKSGSLWFALGFHASWNFTQSFVFGLANSGGSSPQALMVSRLDGPAWLTGGSAGPEGSLLSLAAILTLAVFVHTALQNSGSQPEAAASGE